MHARARLCPPHHAPLVRTEHTSTRLQHLTELQKKLKGSATIVGVTSESDVEVRRAGNAAREVCATHVHACTPRVAPSAPSQKIKEFVAKRGAAMDYTVAVDTRGATAGESACSKHAPRLHHQAGPHQRQPGHKDQGAA